MTLRAKQKLHYLKMLMGAKQMSLDPARKVGALVVASDGTEFLAFNDIAGKEKFLPHIQGDKKTRLQKVDHAEKRALNKAGKHAKGGTVYVYPVPPCTDCIARIVKAGCSKVVFWVTENAPKYEKQFRKARHLLDENGIRVERGNIGDIHLLHFKAAQTDEAFIAFGRQIIDEGYETFHRKAEYVRHINKFADAVHAIEAIKKASEEQGTNFEEQLKEVIVSLCEFSGRFHQHFFLEKSHPVKQSIKAFEERINGKNRLGNEQTIL